jgi:hypothetical protein
MSSADIFRRLALRTFYKVMALQKHTSNPLYEERIKDKFGIILKHLDQGDPLAILNEDYKFLVQKDNYIVDIGANIGDTALYFCHYGMKVLGFEPDPNLYEWALENIRLNNAKEVNIIKGALGKEDKLNEVEIPIYSLTTVIKKFGIPKDANLKIDCEGCEYDIILNSSDETLRHFKRIQIEYHYGRKNLEERLRKAGFKVRSTWLTEIIKKARAKIKDALSKNPTNKRLGPRMIIGYIYAERIN